MYKQDDFIVNFIVYYFLSLALLFNLTFTHLILQTWFNDFISGAGNTALY